MTKKHVISDEALASGEFSAADIVVLKRAARQIARDHAAGRPSRTDDARVYVAALDYLPKETNR